jgi:hypothetical protein
MTEAEWLTCADPAPMLELLKGKASDRKVRLFACACCRHVWCHLTEAGQREVVEWFEAVTDCAVPVDVAPPQFGDEDETVYLVSLPELAARFAVEALRDGHWVNAPAMCARVVSDGGAERGRMHAEKSAQCDILRDILGNPFSPAPQLSPTWLTPKVLSLAQLAYEPRRLPEGTLEPERLVAVAECLEEAGCTEESVLEHLREARPHVRGCWTVDVILGKE